MRKIYLLVSVVLFSLADVFGQCEPDSLEGSLQGNVWAIFANVGLDFNNAFGEDPVVISSSLDGSESAGFGEGCASICNTNGELMFYTNGATVWGADHKIVPSGTDLGSSGRSTQTGVIIPNPVDTNVYYIISNYDIDDVDESTSGFNYCVFDRRLGTNGDVAQKNISVSDSIALCEKIAAVGHGNKKDYWIIFQAWETNKFYAYLIDENGLNPEPIVSTAGDSVVANGKYKDYGKGYMKASSNGKMLAACMQGRGTAAMGWVEVFKFDNRTGIVSEFENRKKSAFNSPYGVEFSPNRQYLYVASRSFRSGDAGVYQYDLLSDNFDQTKVRIGEVYFRDEEGGANKKIGGPGAMQLAPDGKIYIAVRNYTYLGRINSPNLDAANVGFEGSAINLAVVNNGEGKSGEGLPTFIGSFFNSQKIDAGGEIILCLGDSAQLGGEPTVIGGVPPYQYEWTNSEVLDDPISSNPKAYVTATTEFILKVTDKNLCERYDTATVVVGYFPSPDLGDTLYNCPFSDITLKIDTTTSGGIKPYVYEWEDVEGLSATNVSEPVLSMQNAQKSVGLKITDAYGCSGTDTVVIDLKTTNVLDSITPDSITVVKDGESLPVKIVMERTDSTMSYDWTLPEYLSCDDCSNPVFTYKGVENPFDEYDTVYFESVIKDTACAIFPADTARFVLVAQNDDYKQIEEYSFSVTAGTCFNELTSFLVDAEKTEYLDSVRWDFGDGSSEFIKTPLVATEHLYGASGEYEVEAIVYYHNLSQFVHSDTVVQTVEIFALPVPGLPQDTLVCLNDSYTLDKEYSTYKWSTGDETQSITLKTEDIYHVTVVDEHACVQSDSMNVSFFKKVTISDISPEDEVLMLSSESQELTVVVSDTENENVIYDWSAALGSVLTCDDCSDNEFTYSLEMNESDQYDTVAVQLVVSDQTCAHFARETVDFSIVVENELYKEGEFNFTYDKSTICLGDSTKFVLDSTDYVDSVRWVFGDEVEILSKLPIEDTIWHQYPATGTYEAVMYVYYKNLSGFAMVDTTSRTVTINALPEPNLPEQKTVCLNDVFKLGTAYKTYQWSNGISEQTIVLDNEGEYSVTVVNAEGCVRSDTMQISHFKEVDIADITPSDTIVADNNVITDLKVSVTEAGNANVIYEWTATDSAELSCKSCAETELNYTKMMESFDEYDTLDVRSIVTDQTCAHFIPDTAYFVVIAENHEYQTLDFDYTYRDTCHADQTVFSLDITSNIDSVIWDYDDGSFDTLVKPIAKEITHEYADTGVYSASATIYYRNLSLKAYDTSIVKEITIRPLPVVGLPSDTVVCNNFEYQIRNEFTSYSWNTEAKTRDLLLDAEGNYSVTVVNEYGCVSSDQMKVAHHKKASVVAYVPEDTVLLLSNKVQAINLQVSNLPKDNVEIIWTSDANSALKCSDCVEKELAYTKEFIEFDHYDTTAVSVTVEDSTCSYFVTDTVDFSFVVENADYQEKEFTVTYKNTCHNDMTEFTFIDTEMVDKLIWNYGDGTVQTVQAEGFDRAVWEHKYSLPGTYPLQVTVFFHNHSGEQLQKTVSHNVGITPLPSPKFISEPEYVINKYKLSVCKGTPLRTAEAYPSYKWSTGDEKRLIVLNNPGGYSVTVTDSIGCVGSSGLDVSFLQKAAVKNKYPHGSQFVLDTLPQNFSFTMSEGTSERFDFVWSISGEYSTFLETDTSSAVLDLMLDDDQDYLSLHIQCEVTDKLCPLFEPELVSYSTSLYNWDYVFDNDKIVTVVSDSDVAGVCLGDSVKFYVDTDKKVDYFYWTFGDGSEMRGDTVTHLYTGADKYEVKAAIVYYQEEIDTYRVTGTQDSVEIFEVPKYEFRDTLFCAGNTYEGPMGYKYYYWDSLAFDYDTLPESYDTVSNEFIPYNEGLQDVLVWTADNCKLTSEFNVSLHKPDTLISYVPDKHLALFMDEPVELKLLTSADEKDNINMSFDWSDYTYISEGDADKVTFFYPLDESIYVDSVDLYVTVKDVSCPYFPVDTARFSFDIWVGTYLKLPSAFTPNGDGVNETVNFNVSYGIKSLELFKIYDRWGVCVYESTDLTESWDGTYGGKPQPMAAYKYVLEATDIHNRKIKMEGDITLIR